MSLSALTVWEVRTTGSNTNGGGFVAGASGTDWSQQASAQYSVTDGVTDGSTTITSATASFGTDVVGNIMYVEGGTGSVAAGWYEIVSRTNSTTVVVDRSTGLTAGTGATLKIGGAVATGGAIGGSVVAGNTVWIRGGTTYTLASSWIFSNSGDGAGGRIKVRGYGTTRGDGVRPILTSSTDSVNLLQLGWYYTVDSIEFTHTAGTRGYALQIGGEFRISSCVVDGCAALYVAYEYLNGDITSSTIKNCTENGINASSNGCAVSLHGCLFLNNTGIGIASGRNGWVRVKSCAFYGGSHGVYGIGYSTGQNPSVFVQSCSFSGQSNTAIRCDDGGDGFTGIEVTNCVMWAIGGYGIATTGGSSAALIEANTRRIMNNAGGLFTSGFYQNLSSSGGDVTLTADPFTNAASGDFSLNNAAGGGSLCRAAGYPGAFLGGLATGYLDIGAVQHYEPTPAEVATAIWAYPDRSLTA